MTKKLKEKFYTFDELLTILSEESETFSSEKEMSGFLESNLEEFCSVFLGEKVREYKKEWMLGSFANDPMKGTFIGNRARIDYMIETKGNKRIGIECKLCSELFSDSTRSISQILSYILIAKKNNVPFDKVYLVLPRIDLIAAEIIREFKLPIEVFILGKTYAAKMHFL